jgi:hypothetical protein
MPRFSTLGLREDAMREALIGLVVFLLVSGAASLGSAEPKVTGETIRYTTQGVTMVGYLAYDQNTKEPRPGVLVVPECP